MNNLSPTNTTYTGKETEPGGYRESSSSTDSGPVAASYNDRVAELEYENSRLHRLVAELLIKNQQLRKPD
jgi:hypothetical protein